MRGALARCIGVILPAQAEVERKSPGRPPIILHIEAGVVVRDLRDGHGDDRRSAVDAHGDGDIQIVDDAIAVQILEAEIGDEDDGARTEDVDEAAHAVVLKFRAEVQRVVADARR